MATITTEFGKLSSKGQRAVYLRVRDKKTEKRIATGVKVDESEISPRTKKIKNFEKAQIVEKLKTIPPRRRLHPLLYLLFSF